MTGGGGGRGAGGSLDWLGLRGPLDIRVGRQAAGHMRLKLRRGCGWRDEAVEL